MLEYRTIQYKAAATNEYGVALYDCGKMLRCVPRISVCRKDMEQLTALLNEEKVEPCHFEDIIEDYLTDFTV